MELRETETETAKLTWMREDCENVKWGWEGGEREERPRLECVEAKDARARKKEQSVSLSGPTAKCLPHYAMILGSVVTWDTHTEDTHTPHTHMSHTHMARQSDNDNEEGMKWQRSRCLVVSLSRRLSGDLFTFKFSELDDVTSEGTAKGAQGREGIPQQVGDFCIRVVAMRRKRQSTEKVSPRLVFSRLASSSSSFFLWPYEILEKFTKR